MFKKCTTGFCCTRSFQIAPKMRPNMFPPRKSRYWSERRPPSVELHHPGGSEGESANGARCWVVIVPKEPCLLPRMVGFGHVVYLRCFPNFKIICRNRIAFRMNRKTLAWKCQIENTVGLVGSNFFKDTLVTAQTWKKIVELQGQFSVLQPGQKLQLISQHLRLLWIAMWAMGWLHC